MISSLNSKYEVFQTLTVFLFPSKEYNMEAEQILTGLHLDHDEDTDIEVALKLSMVDMYVRKLRERVRRKRIVRDYQLAAKFFSNLREDPTRKHLTKQQRSV